MGFYHQIDNSTGENPSQDDVLSYNEIGEVPMEIDDAYYTIDDLPDLDYRRHPYHHPAVPVGLQSEVDRKFDLVTRKGVYPHEYMVSFDRLEETKLPLQPLFYRFVRFHY